MLAAMGTLAERIRRHINAMAYELAQQQSIPSTRHAQAIVEHIIRKEGGSVPPGHTVASLAKELLAATLQAASGATPRQKIS